MTAILTEREYWKGNICQAYSSVVTLQFITIICPLHHRACPRVKAVVNFRFVVYSYSILVQMSLVSMKDMNHKSEI
jgi:hypothetical protein